MEGSLYIKELAETWSTLVFKTCPLKPFCPQLKCSILIFLTGAGSLQIRVIASKCSQSGTLLNLFTNAYSAIISTVVPLHETCTNCFPYLFSSILLIFRSNHSDAINGSNSCRCRERDHGVAKKRRGQEWRTKKQTAGKATP